LYYPERKKWDQQKRFLTAAEPDLLSTDGAPMSGPVGFFPDSLQSVREELNFYNEKASLLQIPTARGKGVMSLRTGTIREGNYRVHTGHFHAWRDEQGE
jgi:hypothetical protein